MKFLKIVCFFLLSFALSACANEKPKPSRTSKPKKTVKKVAPVKKTEEKTVNDPLPPEQIAKAKEILAGVTEEQVAAVDAKQKYKFTCGTCHGIKGDLGVNGAKDLTASTRPIEENIAIIYFGKGLMTPFKGLLNDAEMVAVMRYIEKELR